MRKNWPYFIVASLLNAVLVTGAFIQFKLRGTTGPELPGRLRIDPFMFSGGIFIISFLLILAIIGLRSLVGYVVKSVQLHVTRYKLHAAAATGNQ
jgi:hypothetical protein